ncbi:MAG: glycoside hydrolase family 57 protein [bacterium]
MADQPLKVALLWHMHQPNYREPAADRLMLPWVRLHATKDYLDMPLLASQFENIRVTFNLVPSLLDQLDCYGRGGTDPALELARTPATELGATQKEEILDSFFTANSSNMIEPYTRYRELYKKARAGGSDGVRAALFSSEEMRDLQVWANLVWVDPMFRTEEPVRSLFDKGRHFTEQEKASLLDWQTGLMSRIVPTYRDLYSEGRLDISFTPYYHPILPLLCDTDAAREAIPNIELPRTRFCHPEDARWHIEQARHRFEAMFGRPLQGMWPSEGSVSEEVVQMMSDLGIKWAATDEEVLYHSLKKAGMDPRDNPIHSVYQYRSGLKLLFRDHALSDRIGFVYSGWEADRAAADFLKHLKQIRTLLGDRLDRSVVAVILDGENAWEYFPEDGREFLSELYRALDTDPGVRTVTMSHAADTIPATALPALFAGSWINHNFKIWIGHHEDNAAWDFLSEVRGRLVEFEKEHPEFDPERLAKAWRQIYVAEGSDWCWWYGDEHRGSNNEQFDAIFRRHLMAVYELLDLEIPIKLLSPIYQRGAGLKAVLPDTLLTPTIDGRQTFFYEWSGAGYFDCLKAGGAMHRVQQLISRIHFVYDHKFLYIRLDFVDSDQLLSLVDAAIVISLYVPGLKRMEVPVTVLGASRGERRNHWHLGDIMEVAVERQWLFEKGYGAIGFGVSLRVAGETIEQWPVGQPIQFEVAQLNHELFWPA